LFDQDYDPKEGFWLDFIPNLLNHPEMAGTEKRHVANSLQERLKTRLPEMVSRYATLPILLVRRGEYYTLLIEARELYIQGYFYSCVAMCGITAERIIKDIFTESLCFKKHDKSQPKGLNDKAKSDLDSFNSKKICDFLISSGILTAKLRKPLTELGKLRNKYAHAGGKDPDNDSRSAIEYLHQIVEGTVSLLNYHKRHYDGGYLCL
jgi:hypothetical protein